MRSLIFFLLLALPPLWATATTTSGATTRGVLIDGNVTTGAAPGTNGIDWETDEVFDGFSLIVNWYVSWDDQNLYLGRIGGNNAEGSVLYIRAEYPGMSTTNRAFNYDALEPECSDMDGINFAAYFKDTYDEFRTWTGGAWTAANTALAPFFSTQGGNAHMEVAIPWNAITNNNGKPSNLRLALFQIAPNAGAPACNPVNHFVYGESPWGTGAFNDGPSVGVNDGLPISLRQPGGCGVGADTLRRWWGCYPVIGGVGSNGWTAIPPNAGPDDSICATATSYILQGNNPAAEALGTWTVAQQPAGANASFQNANIPNTIAQGLNQLGTYLFVWNINYGGCPSTGDTVRIDRVAQPAPAVAGPDQVLNCGLTTATLSGSAPGPYGSGWALASPQGSITSPGSPNTTVTGLGFGVSLLIYQVQGGSACPATSDTVAITTYSPVTADPGADQEHCATSLTTLTAANPQLIQSTATGQWSQFSGPSSLIFTDNTDPTTTVSNLSTGTFILTWTVSNGNCPSVDSTMQITVHAAPIADAGPDRSYCASDFAQLDANNPAGLSATAFGYWTQASGPGPALIADSSLYNTTISGLVQGTYKFTWHLANGNCPVSTDIVTIIVSDITDNGLDSLRRPLQGQFDGYIEVAAPLGGNPPYLYALDGGAYQPDSTFANLGPGTYTISIIDGNGCTDTLRVILSEYTPPPPPPVDSFFIPDAFSPNADGVNDTWEILGIGAYPEAEVQVFNIWGGLIFSAEGAYTPWNGTYQAQPMPQANYYYIVDLKSSAHPVYRGSVTLFR